MSKEIKKLLKEAKEAIGKKDLDFAVQRCDEILKLDATNYAAFLLLGAAFQDNDPPAAINYLKKAVICATDPSVAYQGLLKLVGPNEIPEVCTKLLKLTPQNYANLYKKLETAALVTKNTNSCIEILQNELEQTTDEEQIKCIYQNLLEIFIQCPNLDKRWLELFQETLEIALADPTTNNHQKRFNKYLKVLSQLHKRELLLAKCEEMLKLYPKETFPVECICRAYVENFENSEFEFNKHISGGIEKYANDLLELNPLSPQGLLAKGLFLYQNGNIVGARDCLNKANTNSAMNILCLKTLAATHLKLRAFNLAEYCYSTSKIVNVDYIRCLVEQKTKSKCEQAIELAKSILENHRRDESDILIEFVARAYINIGNCEEAEKIIHNFSSNNKTEQVHVLCAYQHQMSGQFEKAVEILEPMEIESCDHLLKLGQCLFGLQRFQESLTQVLKATKLEPYNSECFHWLGRIYSLNGDVERAKKCFEKSVFLNPQHEQSVVLLSTIYRQNCEWDLNLRLLQTAAQSIPNTWCKWAALQLGFHNLGQNQFDEAIAAFRAVLRLDPNNFASWEGLADVYLKRGSFNSALKVYQKICELTENNSYPRLQVANIKTTLRLYKEAIDSYEDLLKDEPNNVPALKGIAEANLGLANHYLEQRLLGRAKQHTEYAVKYLISAIQIRSNYICLWRLLANGFELVAALPLSQANLKVPGSLANEKVDFVTLQGEKLYELASRFYCRAIKMSNSSDELLWYELAMNYYNRSLRYGPTESKKKYYELAAEATKYIIKLSPGRWKNWNLLGVICATKEINNPELAQHCFIKALELDKKCAIAWTNLGVLYLSEGFHTKLANAAFAHAQQSEPSYHNAWIGQAQIAEVVDRLETIDLLKHSISLGYHDESAVRYAYWVCVLLNDPDISTDKRIRYVIENLHAIPTALDCITWYCVAKGDDVSVEALSFLGFLNFKMKIWNTAIKAFTKAFEKSVDAYQRDKMLCNVAYCYLKNNNPLDAVKAFHDVSEATFQSTIGLAYSHYKAKQYESSYAVYQNALEWLATDDLQKSLILVAISSMIYAFQGEEEAKGVLFQCIGSAEPPIEALLSACSLGILHNDIQLSELVLKELIKHERNTFWCHHVAFLTSELYLKKNEPKRALQYLYSQVHIYPDRPLLRKVLANFLLRNCTKNEKNLLATNRMIESTIVMQRKDVNWKMSSLEIAKLLSLASEATRCLNINMSKKLAQKALHMNPACKEAWSAHMAIVN